MERSSRSPNGKRHHNSCNATHSFHSQVSKSFVTLRCKVFTSTLLNWNAVKLHYCLVAEVGTVVLTRSSTAHSRLHPSLIILTQAVCPQMIWIYRRTFSNTFQGHILCYSRILVYGKYHSATGGVISISLGYRFLST